LCARGRDGVENVSAVELAAGNQVQRGDEEADPSGDQHGVRRDVGKVGDGGVPVHQQRVDQADGERFAAKHDYGGRSVCRGVEAQGKSDRHGQCRCHISGQRPIDAHIHQCVAVGDALRSYDGAGRAAQRGRRQHPGEGGSNAVPAAGEVVAELVDEENAQQGNEKAKPVLNISGWSESHPQGHRSLSRTTGGRPSDKILHEPRAVGGCGDDADGQQEQRKAVFPEGRALEAGSLEVEQAQSSPEKRGLVALCRLHSSAGRRWRSVSDLAGAWSTALGRAGVQRMQFLARFETNGFARGYADFGAGAGIAADAGFAGADAENAKSAQFDALAGGQGLLEALEDRIHRGLRLGARQAVRSIT
jgi:hypothetical protein